MAPATGAQVIALPGRGWPLCHERFRVVPHGRIPTAGEVRRLPGLE